MSDKTAQQIAEEILAKAKGGKANGKTPPPHVERSEGAALLDDVHKFLGRFVVYPSKHAHEAHVLWLLHTHLMTAWESTPRIAFLSPEPASGKTRSMEVSELLVPDPVASINCTPAYLFRKCGSDSGAPCILFDEIDTVFGNRAKEHEELRALLNSGHRRGATAGRCVVRGKIIETEEISSYAAVAMAGLGWLPDTILSRSIIIRMRRRVHAEKVEAFRRRVHAPQGEALRRRLAGWAAGILDEATQARPAFPAGVEDRAADMWEPLLAVADIAGGQWPKRAREAAVVLVAVAREVEPSLNLRLLADLRTVFGSHDALYTKTILAELHHLEGAPWGDIKGKPLSDNQLARRLRNYEVKPADVRIDKVVLKGYRRSDLHDAWRRYLPPLSEEGATGATRATGELFQEAGHSATESEPATDRPEPRHEAAGVAAVGHNVASCSGANDAENPHEISVVAGVAGVALSQGNGGDELPGLSWRAIDQFAGEVEQWAAGRGTDIEPAELGAETRRRLTAAGIFPDAIEIELERVMRCLFEGREARRHPSH
jgi:Protein of unknown function (DUF3631)